MSDNVAGKTGVFKLPGRARKLPAAADLDRRRHAMIPQAVLLGLLTGLVTVAFHVCVDAGAALRDQLLALAHQHRYGPGLVAVYVFAAVLMSAGLVRLVVPEAAGSGIPHLKALLLAERSPFRWLRVLVVKFLSMAIANTGGLVLGREGPSVHMGGAVGQALVRWWPGRRLDRAVMLAAGGGAGLAAAFNAPLSGLTFVLEELERRCGSVEFFAAAISCLLADMICRATLGQHPSFHFDVTGAPPLHLLLAFVPLAVIAGLFGLLFTRCLLWGQRLVGMTLRRSFAWWGLLTALVAAVAWYAPMLLGGGQDFINSMLAGEPLTVQRVCLFFALRFVLTIASASSGAAGGIFMPILALGALLGWGMGAAIHLLFPALAVDVGLFAVVGMAAYFSAVVQAPLTGIVLIIEMTGNYALVLPLFITCFSALLVADWLGAPPIYEAWLELNLRRNALP